MVEAAADPTGGSLPRLHLMLARRLPTTVVSAGVAVVLCSGVVTALVLPASSDSTAVLRHPRAVTVTTSGGSTGKAHDGQVLNPGDIVTVGQAGAGEITTGARKLWLGGASQVRVDGPASTEIRRGSVVAEDPGKPWSLQADQVTVSDLTGAVRIDYGFTIRVADYAGRALLELPTGAGATLTGLDQVEAAGSIVQGGGSSPLKLDDDGLDTVAAPALVTLDQGLNALARQVDADPLVLATYRSPAENPSERLLPTAIAAAGTGGTDAQRSSSAVTARSRQASWGVIAQGIGAALTGIRIDLATLLDSSPTQAAALAAAAAQTAPVASAAAAAPAPATTPVVGPSPSPQPSPVSGSPAVRPTVTLPGVTSRPVPGVTLSPVPAVPAPPTGAPVPVPVPSSTPLLNALLNAVGGLLPSPDPVPSGGLLGGVIGPPSASPTPLVNGLLNTIVGH